MTDYAFAANSPDAELQRLRLLEHALDGGSQRLLEFAGIRPGWTCLDVSRVEARTHLQRGGGSITRVMAESTKALREQYLATGEATNADIDAYIHGALDPQSWALYYTTVGVVAARTC